MLKLLFAKAANSGSSFGPTIANAHAVLARSYTMKLPRRSSAALANAANTCASDELTVANAHAVLASPCTLKSAQTLYELFGSAVPLAAEIDSQQVLGLGNASGSLGSKSFRMRTDWISNCLAMLAANSFTSDWPNVANAHAVLARS